MLGPRFTKYFLGFALNISVRIFQTTLNNVIIPYYKSTLETSLFFLSQSAESIYRPTISMFDRLHQAFLRVNMFKLVMLQMFFMWFFISSCSSQNLSNYRTTQPAKAHLDDGFSLAECSESGPSTSTMTGKILAGYQGWFQGRDNWRHWTRGPVEPAFDNLAFDLWPDMREYPSNSSQPLPNLGGARLFSSDSRATADLHTRWMKDYGIDGVFIQRFALEAFVITNFRNNVLNNMRAAAEEHCRVFSVMYDISDYDRSKNNGKSLFQALTEDWATIRSHTDSPRYLKHNGKPVIAIWGFGVEALHERIANPTEAASIIQWFKDQGLTVMGGVDGMFLEDSSEWTSVYEQFDIVSPWNVGRYDSISSFDSFKRDQINPQKNWANGKQLDYMPVVFPGFSWRNLKGEGSAFNQIPRLGGAFYQHQLHSLINSGHSMIYVAMFDEVDEGTAIFKVAETKNDVPLEVRDRIVTLDEDGYRLQSDAYLRMTGEAAQELRNIYNAGSQIPINNMDVSSEIVFLEKNERINQKCLSGYCVVVQNDRNLILTEGNRATGAHIRQNNLILTNNADHTEFELIMQDDGNLCIQEASLKDNIGKFFCFGMVEGSDPKLVVEDGALKVKTQSNERVIVNL